MSFAEPLAGFTVLWPRMLWLLAVLPVLAFVALRIAARRQRSLAQLPGLWRAAAASGAGHRLRRVLPPVLLFTALAALIGAVARPQALVTLPAIHKDVILAIDVSGSMQATDVQPDRRAAAQSAARRFIERLPSRTRVGIVTVSGNATLIQSPTDNREELRQALERTPLQRGTALGSGIYVSLAALLPDAGLNIEHLVYGRPDFAAPANPAPGAADKSKPVAPGSHRAVAIVLLSDGENNTGPEPLKAAQLAAQHGVRIYTVGIGSAEGIALSYAGWSVRVRLDESTLRKIAETTLGEYYAASTAQDLQRIYEHLSARMVMERASTIEITAFLVVAGALLLALSAFLSTLWFNRVV